MEPNQPESEEPDVVKAPGVYPVPTKGNLSDDHSSYGKPVKWAGTDPDKGMRAYFIGFLVVLTILFIYAVKSLSGGKFWF